MVLFTALILSNPGVLASKPQSNLEAPESLAIAITVDAEHLIELYQAVADLKIIDSRYREDYSRGYIETAYNLPLAKTDCGSLAKLTESKDQAMLFYCNGNLADASIGALQIAAACGYKRLFWFRGGFVEWEDKDYPYLIE
jgi:rhodanese-related sulfurtransferase